MEGGFVGHQMQLALTLLLPHLLRPLGTRELPGGAAPLGTPELPGGASVIEGDQVRQAG